MIAARQPGGAGVCASLCQKFLTNGLSNSDADRAGCRQTINLRNEIIRPTNKITGLQQGRTESRERECHLLRGVSDQKM